jgi:hypothetical protein
VKQQTAQDAGSRETRVRGKSKAGRRRKRFSMAAATVIAAAITGGVSLAIALSGGSSESQSGAAGTTQSQPSGSAGASSSSGSTGQSGAPSGPTGKLYTEVTDNHLGTDVFKDPMGDAVTSGPVSIPYGTHVLVKCWAPNESGMGSINAFYLIETRPWIGDYAPANTFLNADTTGALDPDVPECPAA